MNNYNFSQKGRLATVLPNAMQTLKERGWYKKGTKDYSMKVGTVYFELGEGTDYHFMRLVFNDGEHCDFSPETIKVFPF